MQSDKLYEVYQASSERFDYFIAGLSSALAAYVGQNIKPSPLGLNPESVTVAALACMVLSVVYGFKRIETNVTALGVMYQRLYSEKMSGASEAHKVVARGAEQKEGDLIVASKRYYDRRNFFLIFGFTLLVISRVLPAYLR